MASERGAVIAADRLPPVPATPPRGNLRVLMVGDIIGKPGRDTIEQVVPPLRDERGIDLVTANGENVAGGMGLTVSTAAALFKAGVDVITSRQPHLGQARHLPRAGAR